MSIFQLTLKGLYLFILFAICLFCSHEREQPLAKAHAHNDYEHERPLFDALSLGFISIEADIHLLNDELYVAHDSVDVQKEQTLRKLYLDPLLKRINENGGSVYDDDSQLILLIDIKTDSLATYKKLHEILGKYNNMLTVYSEHKKQEGPVSVIISGNRPISYIRNQKLRYAAVDGRFDVLGSEEGAFLFPLISESWNDHFTWNGENPMSADEEKRFSEIVNQVHHNDQMLRFWGTPDSAGSARDSIWKKLFDAGVDLIGTDDLPALKTFIINKNKH